MDTIIFNFINGKTSFEETCNRLVKTLSDKTYQDCQKILENFQYLDEYDFSEFLTYGRSLYDLINSIEEKCDKDFYEEHGIYMFDNLSIDMIKDYFHARYNIWFQPYTDWVVRKENDINSKARRRIENRS